MCMAFDYRSAAAVHLEFASELLKNGSEASLRYSALELRMCIECLVYEVLGYYRNEVSFEIMRNWQPDKVLKEFIEIDPSLNGSRGINILDPETASFIGGVEYRFKLKWARSSWQSLGSLLHAPTIASTKSRSMKTVAEIVKKLKGIEAELTKVIISEIINIKIDRTYNIMCQCGFEIRRQVQNLKDVNQISCACCGQNYGIEVRNGQVVSAPLVAYWKCPSCKHKNSFPVHEATNGKIVECIACNKKCKLHGKYVLIDP